MYKRQALRSAKAYDSSNEIGQLYSGDTVQLVDTTDAQYWYCLLYTSYGRISLQKAYGFEPIFPGLEEQYHYRVTVYLPGSLTSLVTSNECSCPVSYTHLAGKSIFERRKSGWSPLLSDSPAFFLSGYRTVSYTHLDVYKRQFWRRASPLNSPGRRTTS